MTSSKQTDAAETLALEALAWLAGSETELSRFIEISGIDAGEIRSRAHEAAMLRSVLDFVLSEDERLLAFCAAENLEPKDVHMARHVLDGAR
ncbi:MAG: DUF3572 family protein [Rhizomicrobium sp.]